MGVDYSNLPDELKAKLESWEKETPAHKQLETLTDLADMTQEVVHVLDAIQNSGVKNAQEFGAILIDIREKLATEAPESPDFAKPVTDCMNKLEKALTSSIKALDASVKAIDVKPVVNVPKLDVPEVNISSPGVDLKAIEKILKVELPKAFNASIKAIPQANLDVTPLLEQLEQMSEQLSSIDTGSRMKVQFPSSIKVTNPDGSTVGGGASTYKTLLDDYTTTNVTYVGKAAIGSASSSAVWQIQKIDETTGMVITWAGSAGFTQVWDNRATTVSYS
jgi:hypothetical protein